MAHRSRRCMSVTWTHCSPNWTQTMSCTLYRADLATKWSAYASGHKYKPNQTRIWCNATMLRQWLQNAKARGLRRVRIVMHGGGDYEKLRLAGFDLRYSQPHCARGPGMYVSVADHIPAAYDRSGCLGTGLLGLLLCGDDDDEGIETQPGNSQSLGSGKNVQIYCRYKLDAHTAPRDVHNDRTCVEAIRILDMSRFLPLGLVHT